MTSVIEYGFSNTGLGTTINVLSMLLDSKLPVRLQVPQNSVTWTLKSIFNLNNLELVATDIIENDLNDRISDHGKFYSPYITANTITVLGQQFITGKQHKPMIGVAMSNRGLYTTDLQNIGTKYPDNRFYSLDVYNRVIELIFRSGYDVVSLNDCNISLESKIYFLNEFCDAVIGYEGGMAHLSHTLKVPVIMFPWHHAANGDKDTAEYAAHRYHVDRQTYFLNSANEILLWDPQKFKQIISQLHNGHGNSVYFNTMLNPEPWLSEFEKKFIKQYIKGE
jgi:hypothetical protein